MMIEVTLTSYPDHVATHQGLAQSKGVVAIEGSIRK